MLTTTSSGPWRHGGPVVCFSVLTIAWTWPLVLHLATAVPGEAGDNYSFLWVLWWMRRVLATPALTFFRTDYLFFPFGTSLVDHSHVALPAFVAATVLGRLSIVAAQNVLILAYVLTNCLAAYGLAWDVTRHRRAAVFAGVLFGSSPYLAAHLLGHFELMAAWVLPAFAWALRRALDADSKRAAIVAGLVLVAAAYTTYYYVVYLGLFAVSYLLIWTDCVSVGSHPRVPTRFGLILRRLLLAAFVALAGLAAWIVASGGVSLPVGTTVVSLHRPQNPLTAMWLLALSVLVLGRKSTVHWRRASGERLPRGARTLGIVVSVFGIGAFPLFWQAIRLVQAGEYVSPAYVWRSSSSGVDLLTPLLGHPFHPLTRMLARRAYEAVHANPIESVAWIGVIPLTLLLFGRARPSDRTEARRWWFVGGTFALWAMGPILMIAGIDSGLRLPQMLARLVPFVANARIPGRAMVLVYLAIAILGAMRVAALTGTWQRPWVQWLLIGGLTLEYLDGPVALTTLTESAVYQRLAEAEPGAVCNVPFAVGDGLGRVGPYDLSILYDATLHGHPIAGGFVSRMPPNSAQRYAAMPMVGTLLRLSAEEASVPLAVPTTAFPTAAFPTGAPSPCTYLVVNRLTAAPSLVRYIRTAPLEWLAGDERRDLYRVRTPP